MTRINQDLIRQARQTNLVKYLINKGEPLKRQGKNYIHKDHDSLFFRDNMYNWYSKNDKGNSIDFLVRHMNIDFKTALSELTNKVVPETMETKKRLASESTTLQVSKEFSLPDINKDMRRTFAYLIKTRCINKSIVQNLAKEKQILQDQRGNIVFPWFDEHNEIVGADLNGTLTEKRFKGIVSRSNHNYGYNITIGSPTALYAFESPIDLLSYWSLHSDLQNAILVSLSGLKMETLDSYLKRHTDLSELFLCVDNDSAGKTFIKAVQAHISVSPNQPPETFKDWNDYLKSQVLQ